MESMYDTRYYQISNGIARLITNNCIKTQSPPRDVYEQIPAEFEANSTDFYSWVPSLI